ncbi:Hypothetical protein NTJ_00346 [Nesidiocoris tenuis]|uniref:Uncharacterized protein n=1 Tax=Nesidiocoris tenuis TaxID=355587 RepID=A0ABN7A8H9_9HEMI|nr:Hypothetical protein NTJ_00346 [Nesidiocoris tenuis]
MLHSSLHTLMLLDFIAGGSKGHQREFHDPQQKHRILTHPLSDAEVTTTDSLPQYSNLSSIHNWIMARDRLLQSSRS